jgi:hypothetical protein
MRLLAKFKVVSCVHFASPLCVMSTISLKDKFSVWMLVRQLASNHCKSTAIRVKSEGMTARATSEDFTCKPSLDKSKTRMVVGFHTDESYDAPRACSQAQQPHKMMLCNEHKVQPHLFPPLRTILRHEPKLPSILANETLGYLTGIHW